VAGGRSALVAEESAGGAGEWARWRASSSWPCGASARPGPALREPSAQKPQQLCGAEAHRGLGAGGGGPITCRAWQKSRRRDGAASHRTSHARQKTQREAGDGWGRPHGEKVIGGDGPPHQGQPPNRSGLCDTALKEDRGEKPSRGLDNSGNIEGTPNGLLAPAGCPTGTGVGPP
jgi:hypothetical protein